MDDAQLVSDLSEEDLLERIFPLLPTGSATILGPGDDAALVAAPDGRVVVSADILVEGRHFRRDWSTGEDVGARAAAQNLADIAAMGARPTSMVVSLAVPGELEVSWVTGFANGLRAVCEPHSVGVVGGDLSGADEIVVAVTVHGDLEGREPVLRSGARPGHVLAIAGTLGRSGAGLALLSAHTHPGQGTSDAELVGTYLRPDPPLAAGPAASKAGASAMLDVSDGLLRDAGRLARASGVRIDIDSAALAEDVAAVSDAASWLDVDPLEWVLTSGEDHGLLATFPTGATLPERFRAIGRVFARDTRLPGEASVRKLPPVLVDGRPHSGGSGWDHFRNGQPRR